MARRRTNDHRMHIGRKNKRGMGLPIEEKIKIHLGMRMGDAPQGFIRKPANPFQLIVDEQPRIDNNFK